jgi:hypothetical protein
LLHIPGQNFAANSYGTQNTHHKIWALCENLIHILRFSLDRIFPAVDTANPDSGDRGSARRTQSRLIKSGLTTKLTRVFRNTIQREVTAPRFVRAKWQACYEALIDQTADGRSFSFADAKFGAAKFVLRTFAKPWRLRRDYGSYGLDRIRARITSATTEE